ncbi:MAG TPA: hypothetical protein VIT92_16405 [Burkholderiaceae bacterium]
MKTTSIKIALGVAAGFAAGLAVSHLPAAVATPASASATTPELSGRVFDVAVFEVKQKLTPGQFMGEEFAGSYLRTFTLSDGSKRQVELTPMVHKGMQVVRIKDNAGTTYSGLNGMTLNGTLLIDLQDRAAQQASLKAAGWPVQ